MTVCLISAPWVTDFEEVEDAQRNEVRRLTRAPHLGVLALAAILDQRGDTPHIISLNSCYYDYLKLGTRDGEHFAAYAAETILTAKADIYGFSTLCNSYPTTVRIAERVKRSQPDCVILFGGPQASAVDLTTLEAFPFVDFILRYEADETLPFFLDELSQGHNLEAVAGLTWRSSSGSLIRNVNPPIIQDLDPLPLPAFHLTGELVHATSAPLEVGRGCPFACTFCSTSNFFRRNYRLKSPQRVLDNMRFIATTWGIREFHLQHDMFTLNRHKVIEFCECMLDSGDDFTWGCSARTDCVDEELLELMALAGCRDIFLGVESGSSRIQKLINKNLDVTRSREVISAADRLGIRTMVSVMTGFPDETWEDVRQTVSIYMHSLSHAASSPQLNLLAPLAGTSIYTRYREQLALEELCSDMSHQGRKQNSADRSLIRAYPDIFPNFYLAPSPSLDRDFLTELREFLLMAQTNLRWLLVAIRHAGTDVLDMFCSWRKERTHFHPALSGWELRTYYMNERSRLEFARFVQDWFGSGIPAIVECLAKFCRAVAAAKNAQTARSKGELATGPITRTDIPLRNSHVHVLRFDWDVQGVIDSLKRQAPIDVVDRRPRFFRTQEQEEDRRIIETTPLIATGLGACNGRNTVEDFTREVSRVLDGDLAARRRVAECLLQMLLKEHLVSVQRPTSRAANRKEERNPSCATSAVPN